MTTYHKETGFHSVLLIGDHKLNMTPCSLHKVQVIDPFNLDQINYYDWSNSVDLNVLFDLIKTYPNKSIMSCGKTRIFTRLQDTIV